VGWGTTSLVSLNPGHVLAVPSPGNHQPVILRPWRAWMDKIRNKAGRFDYDIVQHFCLVFLPNSETKYGRMPGI
jgi:hypothetical protein